MYLAANSTRRRTTKAWGVHPNVPLKEREKCASLRGLARFDGERFYSVQSAPELPLDGITGVVETADGDLWLNARAGIVHIAATELEHLKIHQRHIRIELPVQLHRLISV